MAGADVLTHERQGGTSAELADLIRERVQYCIRHHRALDVRAAMEGVMPLLSAIVAVRTGRSRQPDSDPDAWQTQLLLAFQLLILATGEPTTSFCCRTILVHCKLRMSR